MTPHAKIYLAHFDLTTDEVVPCEICGRPARDIHHIYGRGEGKNVIENLAALCREHHNACHGIGNTYLHKDVIQQIHNQYLQRCN